MGLLSKPFGHKTEEVDEHGIGGAYARHDSEPDHVVNPRVPDARLPASVEKEWDQRNDKTRHDSINKNAQQAEPVTGSRSAFVGLHTQIHDPGGKQAKQHEPDEPNRRWMIRPSIQDSDRYDEKAGGNNKLALSANHVGRAMWI